MPTERIMMYNNNNNLNMPDRLSSGLTTTALSIGLSQDGLAKLATGDITTKNKIIKLALNITTIVTWNVRTLIMCVKLEELSQ